MDPYRCVPIRAAGHSRIHVLSLAERRRVDAAIDERPLISGQPRIAVTGVAASPSRVYSTNSPGKSTRRSSGTAASSRTWSAARGRCASACGPRGRRARRRPPPRRALAPREPLADRGRGRRGAARRRVRAAVDRQLVAHAGRAARDLDDGDAAAAARGRERALVRAPARVSSPETSASCSPPKRPAPPAPPPAAVSSSSRYCVSLARRAARRALRASACVSVGLITSTAIAPSSPTTAPAPPARPRRRRGRRSRP